MVTMLILHLVLAKHTFDSLHDSVLGGVIWVVLGGNFQDSRQQLLIVIQQVTDNLSDLW